MSTIGRSQKCVPVANLARERRDAEAHEIEEIQEKYELHEESSGNWRFDTLANAAKAAVDAIRSMPPGACPVFTYARAVYSFQESRGEPLKRDELKPAFDTWWSIWDNPDKCDYDECRLLFQDGLPRVKRGLHKESLNRAIYLADSKPIPPEAQRYESPRIRRLVAVCRELQIMNGAEPFYLSRRDAAKIAGYKRPENGTVFLNGLSTDEVIKPVNKGHIDPSGKKIASTYRFCFARSDNPPAAV